MHGSLWNKKRRIKLCHRDPELCLLAEIYLWRRIVALDENTSLLRDAIAFETNPDYPPCERILGARAKASFDTLTFPNEACACLVDIGKAPIGVCRNQSENGIAGLDDGTSLLVALDD